MREEDICRMCNDQEVRADGSVTRMSTVCMHLHMF